MSANFNTRIVTNGLVIYLDAANRKSHPKTGSTWYDMSGGSHDAVLVGTSYSNSNLGSVEFLSSENDTGIVDYTTPLNDFTACAWFKRPSVAEEMYYERILDKNPGKGIWIGRNGFNANQWGGGVKEEDINGNPSGRFVTLAQDQWHYIVSRRAGDTHTISGNGGEVSVSGTVTTTEIPDSELRIGVDHRERDGFFDGNIAVVQLYNRALTDAEIKQNFNAHRGRFGK